MVDKVFQKENNLTQLNLAYQTILHPLKLWKLSQSLCTKYFLFRVKKSSYVAPYIEQFSTFIDDLLK